MITEKLYYQDSHKTTFTAAVTACGEGEKGYEIRLNRTAFYPGGGGQPCDTGTLGGVEVTGVHEQDGEIIHSCASPLPSGTEITGTINWTRRFDVMQQHSGEHIVSGLIHAAYGYDNVGFHIGHDMVTIDLSGELDTEQLSEIETQANEIIWRNEEVKCFYPDAETLAVLPYRSKKALTGAVRLVEFPGADLCACCGTHVKRTGEIGPVRLLSCVKFRGGARVELLCGGRALRYEQAVFAQNRKISNLFSAKPLETAAAAERTAGELARWKYRAVGLEDRLFAAMAGSLRGKGDTLLFEPGLTPDGLRRLAAAVSDTCGGIAMAFSPGVDGTGYALCRPGGDLRPLCKAMNQALNGRGGGKPELVQGFVQAGENEIRAFFTKQEG